MNKSSDQIPLNSIHQIDNILVRNVLLICHSRRKLMLLIGVFSALIFTTSSFDDALYIDGESVGLLEDYVMFAIVFMFFFVPSVLNSLTRTYNQVMQEKEIYLDVPDEKLKNFEKKIIDDMTLNSSISKFICRTFIGIGLVFFVIFQLIVPISGISTSSSWSIEPSTYPFVYLAATLWGLTYSTIIVPIILWYTFQLAYSVFGEIAEFSRNDQLKINPKSPDGVGGLRILGNLSVRIAQVPSLGVIFLASWILMFGFDFASLVVSTLFIPFIIGIFLWPLRGVHETMVRARDQAIKDINLLFEIENERLISLMDTEESEFPTHQAQNILALYTMYDHVLNMPLWPFDRLTLSRIGTVVVIPFASGISVLLQGLFI